MRASSDALLAYFHDSPLWWTKRVVTVHPLGGSPMGRHVHEGVVDSFGESFGYPGLYVVDGSLMPGPVGPNPAFTIAALADRAAEHLLSQPRAARPSAPVGRGRARAGGPAGRGSQRPVHRTDEGLPGPGRDRPGGRLGGGPPARAPLHVRVDHRGARHGPLPRVRRPPGDRRGLRPVRAARRPVAGGAGLVQPVRPDHSGGHQGDALPLVVARSRREPR